MNILKLQNQYSWLQSDERDIKDLLWTKLRFREKNYYHSSLYKQKKWDGYKEFFKKESGRFLTGLLPEVLLALTHLKREYHILDERSPFKFATTKIDKNFLNQWAPEGKEVTLHDYQVDIIEKMSQAHRGLVVAPTGAGKTYIIIAGLKCLPPKCPTVVLTKNVDLARQIYADLGEWKFPRLGRVLGGKKPVFEPGLITVANIDSIHKMEKLLPHIRAVFVDEIHIMMSAVPCTAYRKMPNAYVRFGISATPFKFGGTDTCQRYDTKGHFGPVIRPFGGNLTTKELQDRKILAPSKCVFYPIHEPMLPYETYQDATTLGIAENLHFNTIVAKLAKKIGGRTLIIVERIKHGEMLHALIPGSKWVYGQDGEKARDEMKAALQKGEKAVCIVQQQLISAGINVFIHNLINAMGSKATHHLIQRLGRGLRKADDKDILNYYDFTHYTNDYLYSHSLLRLKTFRDEGHEVIEKDEVDF